LRIVAITRLTMPYESDRVSSGASSPHGGSPSRVRATCSACACSAASSARIGAKRAGSQVDSNTSMPGRAITPPRSSATV
jgi:hypothetical protein